MVSLYRPRPGGPYYLKWREPGTGRQVNRSLGTTDRKEAVAQRAQLELELRRLNQPRSAYPTVQEYWQQYALWHADHNKASHDRVAQLFRDHILPEFGPTPLNEITKNTVELWVQRRAKKVAAGTVSKELRQFKALMNHALDSEIIERNPIKKVQGPKDLDDAPIVFYTRSELDKLYEASPFHGPIWKLLANTGLRRSEALHLEWSHIVDTKLQVLSTSTVRTKSGKHRVIPVNKEAAAALKALKVKSGSKGRVLGITTGEALSHAFFKCVSRAKLPGNLHCLRHTFCTHLVLAGTPINVVKELAGHSTIAVTEKYLHVRDEHKVAATEILEL